MPLSVRLLISLTLMATVLGLLNVFVLRRAAAAFGLSARQRRIVLALLAVPSVGTVLLRATGRMLPVGSAQPFAVAVSAAEMGVVIAAVLLGVATLVRRVAAGVRRSRVHVAKPALDTTDANPPEPPPSPVVPVTRRAFVEQAVVGSALAVGGGSAAYGALFGRHDYELCTVPVPIPGLSKAADGFTIVQLSDIHLGMMVGEAEMRAAEELARKAKGDLIVLTGDLVDHDPRYVEHLGRLVRRLSAISPVTAIPGNHDYYTGVDEVLGALRSAGATVLVNQATTLLGDRGGIVLAGLDDFNGRELGRGPDLDAALATVRSDAPRIVLCHNPRAFLDLAGQVALQISGHTHGGQVNVGLRPASVVLRHRFIAGLYESNGSRIYVNRGFGTAGPAARVGAPPEVSRLVLVSA